MTAGGISMYKWWNKRSIHLLSNFHNPTIIKNVRRKQNTGEIIAVTIIDYNSNMFYVDKFDHLKFNYENRKSQKWWKCIF